MESTMSAGSREALEARFALRVGARLTQGTAALPHDVSERLRFAREQALSRARAVQRAQVASPVVVSVASGRGTLAAGGGSGGWWRRFAAVVPLCALVGGLLLIQQLHTDSQISAAAEMDTAVLSDDVPPAAYSDPGFLEFLKTPAE